MYNGCRHIKSSGLPCRARALDGGNFCYFHAHLHNHPAGPEATVLKLPLIEDVAAIPLAVARISEALIAGRIDVKKSAQLLWGLKLVFQAITFPRDDQDENENGPEESVASVTQTPEGDELGPEEVYCFPSAQECGACESTTCPDSPCCEEPDEDEDDGEEDQDEEEAADEDEDDEEEEEEDESLGGSDDGDSEDDDDDEDPDEDDEEGAPDAGDEGDDEEDNDDESTRELVAQAKSLESAINAIDNGDMRKATRLLRISSP